MNLRKYSRITALLLIVSILYTGILTAFVVYQHIELNRLKAESVVIVID